MTPRHPAWLAGLLALALATATASAADIDRDRLGTQLARHEDWRAGVYQDSEGIPTVGVGFNLTRSDARARLGRLGLDLDRVVAGKQKLSDAQIRTLLNDDIDTALVDCRTLFPKFDALTEARQRVLADMMFNLGRSRFSGFKNMIAAVNRGDFDRAAEEMRRSKWHDQVKSRAVTLERMMRAGSD